MTTTKDTLKTSSSILPPNSPLKMAQNESQKIESIPDQNSMTPPALKHGSNQEQQALEKVRDLLFGSAQRQTADRISHLEDELREAEARFNTKLEALEQRLQDSERRLDAERRGTIRSIGDSLRKLSEEVHQIAERPSKTPL